MRNWYKYEVIMQSEVEPYDDNENNFERYAAQMGGYTADNNYESRKAFIDRYLKKEGHGRLLIFNTFLQKNLTLDMKILSVASGRAACELALIEDGYNIACSDLAQPPFLPKLREIFGNFSYETLDILGQVGDNKYDAIICSSLIYTFDTQQFNLFLSNISKLLKNNGIFIMDYVGAPDNIWAFLLHNVYLPIEARFYAIYQSVRYRRFYSVLKTFHGYRRSNQEIKDALQQKGLALFAYGEGGELIDFYRGYILPKFINKPGFKSLFLWVGTRMPYVRVGSFRKII